MHRRYPTDDDDDKLVVVPPGRDYSDEQIISLTEFQERFFEPSVTRQVASRREFLRIGFIRHTVRASATRFAGSQIGNTLAATQLFGTIFRRKRLLRSGILHLDNR